jgi:hypothetical protein
MLKFNLILFLLLWISPLVESGSASQIDPIISAIQDGSSSELARFFNPTISLNINGQQGEYSKNQAEIVLKDFFKKNPPIDFSLVFKNENQSSVSTYIGEYASGQGSYKVFIKVSQVESSFRIYGLDFVKS